MKKLLILVAFIAMLSSCTNKKYVAKSVVGNNKAAVTAREGIFNVGDTVWVSRRHGGIRLLPSEQTVDNAVFMKMVITAKR